MSVKIQILHPAGLSALTVDKAYEEKGLAAFATLRGGFSVAIEDDESGSVYLVRDHMGTLPLYYCRKGGKWYYASSVQELLDANATERQLSPEGVMTLFTYGSVQEPYTLIKGVESVPPGCYLELSKEGGAKLTRYWDLPAKIEHKEWLFEEAQEAVSAALNDAIGHCLTATGVHSAFLSGGIDSSAVVALMRQNTAVDIDTFALVFDNMNYDERKWARMVAERNGTRHHEFLLSNEVFRSYAEKVLASYDQPSHDGTNTWFVSRFAKESGVDSAFTGIGGDELFAGYNQFRSFRRVYEAARWMRPIPSFLSPLLVRLSPRAYLKKAAGICGTLQEPYYAARSIFTAGQRNALVNCPPMEVGAIRTVPVPLGNDGIINRISAFELRNYVLSTALRDGDQMGRAVGFTAISPLLDYKLVELLLSIRGGLKLDSKVPKVLLVNAAGKGIPSECVHRAKKGFVLPFDDYLTSCMQDRLSALGAGDVCSALRAGGVRNMLNAYYAKRISWTQVWLVLAFDDYCRRNRLTF